MEYRHYHAQCSSTTRMRNFNYVSHSIYVRRASVSFFILYIALPISFIDIIHWLLRMNEHKDRCKSSLIHGKWSWKYFPNCKEFTTHWTWAIRAAIKQLSGLTVMAHIYIYVCIWRENTEGMRMRCWPSWMAGIKCWYDISDKKLKIITPGLESYMWQLNISHNLTIAWYNNCGLLWNCIPNSIQHFDAAFSKAITVFPCTGHSPTYAIRMRAQLTGVRNLSYPCLHA